ncbi:MAG: hypothetical protein GEU74_07900 [Nitriliruptorales bacterium]|nr:hypothetical protein [Nitriliruptorales bacterium]
MDVRQGDVVVAGEPCLVDRGELIGRDHLLVEVVHLVGNELQFDRDDDAEQAVAPDDRSEQFCVLPTVGVQQPTVGEHDVQ